jgi:hypothetical protein
MFVWPAERHNDTLRIAATSTCSKFAYVPSRSRIGAARNEVGCRKLVLMESRDKEPPGGAFEELFELAKSRAQ